MSRCGSPYSSLAERLFANSVHDPETDCRLWTGAVTPGPKGGYGKIKVWCREIHKRKNLFAHRVSYTLFIGQIPHFHDIDHICRNRACINPSHLRAVEATEHRARTGFPKANPGRRLSLGTEL
jgi:hypothetical protein